VKNLIGLLAIIFIATSTNQVFAKDVLKDVNKNSIFFVKANADIDSATDAKGELTYFLFKQGVNIVTDESKADFILEISSLNFRWGVFDATHVEIGIDLIERSSSKVIAHHDIEEDVRISWFSKSEAINAAISQLDSDRDLIYFVDHTKN
jgi:hypothetical protein